MEKTMEKSLHLPNPEDSYIQVPKYTAAWQTPGIMVILVWN